MKTSQLVFLSPLGNYMSQLYELSLHNVSKPYMNKKSV